MGPPEAGQAVIDVCISNNRKNLIHRKRSPFPLQGKAPARADLKTIAKQNHPSVPGGTEGCSVFLVQMIG